MAQLRRCSEGIPKLSSTGSFQYVILVTRMLFPPSCLKRGCSISFPPVPTRPLLAPSSLFFRFLSFDSTRQYFASYFMVLLGIAEFCAATKVLALGGEGGAWLTWGQMLGLWAATWCTQPRTPPTTIPPRTDYQNSGVRQIQLASWRSIPSSVGRAERGKAKWLPGTPHL